MQAHYRNHLLAFFSASLLTPVAVAWADDLLNHVPTDSAAVLMIQRPVQAAAEVERLRRRIMHIMRLPPGEPITQEAILSRMGIEEGWCDARQPVVLILLSAEMETPRIAVGFTRRGERFEAFGPAPGEGPRVRRLKERNGAHGYGTRLGEQVFISTGKSAVERLARLDKKQSLGSTLNTQQRKLYDGSTLWLHADVSQWNSKVEPMFDQVAMFLKLMGSMQAGANAEASSAVFDWMLGGVKTVLNEMKSLQVAVRFDSDGILLTHLHTFTDGGKVAGYLGQARQQRVDSFAGLPDEPFLAAIASDWQGGDTLQAGLVEKMSQLPSMKAKHKEAELQKLRETLTAWNNDMRTSDVLLATGRERSLPLRLYATYECGDAKASLERLASMQCAAQEMMDFLPGMGCAGQLENTVVDGISAKEVRVDFSKLDAVARKGLDMMYGLDARFLMSAMSKHRIGYVLSSEPAAIARLARMKPEQSLARNGEVKHIMSRLPEHPHVVAIVNLTQALAMAPELAVAGGGGAAPFEIPARARRGTGALVGWSMKLDKASARGDLYVSHENVMRMMRLVSLMHGLEDAEAGAASSRSAEEEP